MRSDSLVKLASFLVLVFLTASAAGCGGGGGGDEGGSGSTIPEGTITYNVGNYWYSEAGQDLLISRREAASAAVWADLQGEYDTRTGFVTMETGRSMIIQSTSLWNKYNSYVNACRITVTDGIEMNKGEFPAKGSWTITFSGQDFDLLGFDSILLEINDTGVDITSYLEGEAVQDMSETLTWDQLEGIEDQEDPPAYRLFNWIGFSVWMLYYEIIFIEGNTAKIIGDHLENFILSDTINIDGAVFPPGSGIAGELSISWIDTSGDGSFGLRDSFSCSFTNWWENDPSFDYGMLLNGKLNLTDSTKNGNNAGFNCIFDGFTLQETYNGSADMDSTLTLNGGFHLSVSW